MPDNSDIPTLSYEAARDELVDVVARLEAGGEPLERSLDLWERGEALAARCQQWLDGARERLAVAQGQVTQGQVAQGQVAQGQPAPDRDEDDA